MKTDAVTTLHCYIALYKPALTLCSLQADSERAWRKHRPPRPTLADLDLPQEHLDSLHLCGRLDRDSEGLLLLTTDGQFTQYCTSPDSHCHKRYLVLVKGVPNKSALHQMQQGGLYIKGHITRPPVAVRRIDPPTFLPNPVPGMDWGQSWLEVILDEGKNRQVRRMTKAVGHPTVRLVRVGLGNLSLGNLKQPGAWKYIDPRQVAGAWSNSDPVPLS